MLVKELLGDGQEQEAADCQKGGRCLTCCCVACGDVCKWLGKAGCWPLGGSLVDLITKTLGSSLQVFCDSHLLRKYVLNIWQCITFHMDSHIDILGTVMFVKKNFKMIQNIRELF